MKYNRIIPRLDIKGPNLVKGIHLEGLRVLGKPHEFANLYYEQGADELIYQDAVASLYERNSLVEIISKTSKDIFIPLTVGGGLRTKQDIKKVLSAGADKVSINTAAIKSPDFINSASRVFGSSTIVVSIEAIKQSDGHYLAYTDNGREHTGIDVFSWVQEVESRGAGEILLTSIDNEGTGKGFDHDLVKEVTSLVSIPVIAHGGAKSKDDIFSVINDDNVDAVCIASMLHYSTLNKFNNNKTFYKDEGNIEFLNNNKGFNLFGEENLVNIKKYLLNLNMNVRI